MRIVCLEVNLHYFRFEMLPVLDLNIETKKKAVSLFVI